MTTNIFNIIVLLLISKIGFGQILSGARDPLNNLRPVVTELKYNSKLKIKKVNVFEKKYEKDSLTDSCLFYTASFSRNRDTSFYRFFDISDSAYITVTKKKNLWRTKISAYKNNKLLFWNKYNKDDSLVQTKSLLYKNKVRYYRDRKGRLLNIKNSTNCGSIDFFTYGNEGELKSRGGVNKNKDTSFIVNYVYNSKMELIEEIREYFSPEKHKVLILYKYDSLRHCTNKLWWELWEGYAVEFYNDTMDYYSNCLAVKHKDFDRLNGSLISQSYYEQNKEGLLIQYCNFNNQCYHFEYNDSLKLLNYYISDANDSIISSKTFVYETGYLVKEVNLLGKGDFSVWEYDIKGKLIKETNYKNKVKTKEVKYSYNELNLLLEKVVINYSHKGLVKVIYNFEYEY